MKQEKMKMVIKYHKTAQRKLILIRLRLERREYAMRSRQSTKWLTGINLHQLAFNGTGGKLTKFKPISTFQMPFLEFQHHHISRVDRRMGNGGFLVCNELTYLSPHAHRYEPKDGAPLNILRKYSSHKQKVAPSVKSKVAPANTYVLYGRNHPCEDTRADTITSIISDILWRVLPSIDHMAAVTSESFYDKKVTFH